MKTAKEWVEELASNCLMFFTGLEHNLDTGEKKACHVLEYHNNNAETIIQQAQAEAFAAGLEAARIASMNVLNVGSLNRVPEASHSIQNPYQQPPNQRGGVTWESL